MKNALLMLCTATLLPAIGAGDAIAQAPGFGIGWGFTRTYWDGTWYKDGYAEAGTGGNVLSLRKEMPIAARTSLAGYLSFMWMRHTTTTLIEPVVVNPLNDEIISGGALHTQTHRTYYREWGFGFNLQRFLTTGDHVFYVGGGPSVRWGQAGKRNIMEDPPGEVHKAAWFGLNLLAGYRTNWNGKTTYFEPHLTFSPDPADRWQETYPPVNLTFQMGILW